MLIGPQESRERSSTHLIGGTGRARGGLESFMLNILGHEDQIRKAMGKRVGNQAWKFVQLYSFPFNLFFQNYVEPAGKIEKNG